MNLWDILVSALILAALALAVSFFARKNGRDGPACGGDCANCLKSCEDREDVMK